MSKIIQTSALLAALVATVAGHTAVKTFEANGVSYPGYYQGSKVDPGNKSPAWWTNQGWGYAPVYGSSLNAADMIAHIDASPSPYTVEAPAGKNVSFTWFHEGTCGGDETGWDCSHHGWTATYLAPCNGDCKNVDKTTLEFFKIHQSALIDYPSGRYSEGSQPEAYTGYWGTDAIFYDNDGKQSVKIPSAIPNGNYVLRTEVMSIHNNGAIGNRQFWPQAFNIQVTGGDDSASMPAGVKATDLYKATDALLTFDLYWHVAGWTDDLVPGSNLAACTSSSSSKARRSHPRQFSS